MHPGNTCPCAGEQDQDQILPSSASLGYMLGAKFKARLSLPALARSLHTQLFFIPFLKISRLNTFSLSGLDSTQLFPAEEALTCGPSSPDDRGLAPLPPVVKGCRAQQPAAAGRSHTQDALAHPAARPVSSAPYPEQPFYF